MYNKAYSLVKATKNPFPQRECLSILKHPKLGNQVKYRSTFCRTFCFIEKVNRYMQFIYEKFLLKYKDYLRIECLILSVY